MAHTHTAEIFWERGKQTFTDQRYSRRHWLRFDGGLEVPGSSSPQVVPVPASDPQALDPEEALVSAISSCHMLWFLSIAAREGFVVDSYHDQAVGTMRPNARHKLWMASVALHPKWSSRTASPALPSLPACTTRRMKSATSPIRSRRTSRFCLGHEEGEA